ncbi:MAG: hypothetical protein RLY57_413 [Candidatus Parcubacteria bacterium]|jgi:hypothetical protein
MKYARFKYLLFALIDTYFAIIFFSERAATLLPFLISPFVFVLFLAFFQNPQLFMRQWNSWLATILKFAFLLVGGYIFYKVGHFPILNDFLTQWSRQVYLISVGRVAGVLFVFLATFSQMCFVLGIIFNICACIFPKKFSDDTSEYTMTFFKALIPTIIFTLLFIFGLPYIGSLIAQ